MSGASVHGSPHLSYESFRQAAPAAYSAMVALGAAVDESGLDKSLTELVKLRVSQLNGCAFCVQFHLNLLRRLGVDPVKIDLVAVWREAGVHDARERAALGWAEQLTAMAAQPLPDDAWAVLRTQFSEDEAAFLTVSVATIQAWNRIAGGLRFAPPVPRGARAG